MKFFRSFTFILAILGAPLSWTKELAFERIHSSIATGNLSDLKKIVEPLSDVNRLITPNETLLMHAAREGQLEIAQWLHLRLRANLNVANGTGQRALSFAILNGHQALSAWLIRHGAEVGYVYGENRSSPLFDAILMNDLKTTQLILNRRRELIRSTIIDLSTKKTYSPESWAEKNGQEEILNYLRSLNQRLALK